MGKSQEINEPKYYIYAHISGCGEVFYIGKGCGKRAWQKTNRSVCWNRVVNKHGYSVEILERIEDEAKAYKREIEFIKMARVLNLCKTNISDGGDGVKVKNRWWYHKVSASLKGKKRPRGKDSLSYKDVISKEVLEEMYVTKKMPLPSISKKTGVSIPTIASRLKEYKIKARSPGKKKRKIVCLTTGEVFESINDASREYKLYRENIRKVLNGQYKHTGQLSFKYVNDDK